MSAFKAKVEGARKLTAETRERAARLALALGAVSEAIAGAAAEGKDRLTITAPPGQDWSHTRAAAALEKELKAAGVSVAWGYRLANDGTSASEVEISWRA